MPWNPPYAELIAVDQSVSDLNRVYAEALIDELFTADEAAQLVEYLNGHYSEGSHHIKSYEFPITELVLGFGGLSYGGPTGLFEVWEYNDDWNMQFRVTGYFDLRNYEPLPDRESDLRRRRIFASGTIYMIKGKIVWGPDLEKIAPLN